jgi:hypothetical protein
MLSMHRMHDSHPTLMTPNSLNSLFHPSTFLPLYFGTGEHIQFILYQVLRGLKYIHSAEVRLCFSGVSIICCYLCFVGLVGLVFADLFIISSVHACGAFVRCCIAISSHRTSLLTRTLTSVFVTLGWHEQIRMQTALPLGASPTTPFSPVGPSN